MWRSHVSSRSPHCARTARFPPNSTDIPANPTVLPSKSRPERRTRLSCAIMVPDWMAGSAHVWNASRRLGGGGNLLIMCGTRPGDWVGDAWNASRRLGGGETFFPPAASWEDASSGLGENGSGGWCSGTGFPEKSREGGCGGKIRKSDVPPSWQKPEPPPEAGKSRRGRRQGAQIGYGPSSALAAEIRDIGGEPPGRRVFGSVEQTHRDQRRSHGAEPHRPNHLRPLSFHGEQDILGGETEEQESAAAEVSFLRRERGACFVLFIVRGSDLQYHDKKRYTVLFINIFSLRKWKCPYAKSGFRAYVPDVRAATRSKAQYVPRKAGWPAGRSTNRTAPRKKYKQDGTQEEVQTGLPSSGNPVVVGAAAIFRRQIRKVYRYARRG